MKKLIKFLDGAAALVLALVVCGNLYVFAARQVTGALQPDVFGISWAVVLSGSMEPEISVDDLVIVRRQEGYGVGDVISFESGASVVTHRIVGEENGLFTTKGDANNIEDAQAVSEEQIVGKVVGTIPKVGAAIAFLKSPLGMTLLVLTGLFAIAAPRIFGKEE